MFHLSIYYPNLKYSMPRGRDLRKVAILTHLPTGRRWEFPSKRAGLAALATYTAMVKDGRLSILPVAEPVAA
jgi:hypothetical protein